MTTKHDGVFRFNGLGAYQADVYWLGSFFHYNEDIMMDRWSLSGFFNYNFGNVREETSPDTYEKALSSLRNLKKANEVCLFKFTIILGAS